MSLINDALKRAKQAQQQRPPSAASDPQLRPLETAHHTASTPGVLVPVLLVVLVGIGAWFLWEDLRDRSPAPQAAIPTQTPVTAQPTSPTPPVQSAVTATKPTPPMPAAAAAPPPAAEPVPATPSAAPVAAAQPPPKPAAPKLEGIFYRPDRPAAVLDGRMVFVGDRLGTFQVREITRTRVTVTTPDQTNVLSLPE